MMDNPAERSLPMRTSGLCPLYQYQPWRTEPQSRQEAPILVVDDDPFLLKLLSMELEDAGYRVLTATDGAQEVIQGETTRLGLIITDVHMPGIGGLDAYRRLRMSRLVSPLLPFIFLTGLRLESIRDVLPPDPHVRMIPKPIDLPQLRTAILELTGVDRSLVAEARDARMVVK